MIALVTGAGSGLGLATANRFKSLKYKVAYCDINWTEEISENDNILKLHMDVTNEDQVKECVEKVIQKFGKIDILVNSAGVVSLGFFLSKRGDMIDNDEIWRCLKINLVGTITVSKYVAKSMIDTKTSGTIINISSVAGIEGARGFLAYAASKGGVIGITLPMARDLGKYGIRVVTLAPQVFKTPMGNLNPIQDKTIQQTPLTRTGDPQEFADAVEGIVQCGYLNGCVIRLDGGYRMASL